MSYYITGFNGVDLQATCGVVTPEVSGVHDLPPLDVDIQKLPGGTTPHLTVLANDFRKVQFGAVVTGTTHAELVANLRSLRGYLRPDTDFHPLVVADRSDERIMALCVEGFRVQTQYLPDDYDVVEIPLQFLCYPYWEDLTEQSVLVAATFLSFLQATIEDDTLGDCGWHGYNSGIPTSDGTDPHSGDYCMEVVAGGGGNKGAKTPDAGIAGITAANDYSLQAYAKGAAGGETITASICWFDSGSGYLSESTEVWTLTDEWAQYKAEGKTAPAGAAKASIRFYDDAASTFYIDDVCLEEAATCGDFITPADANTKVYNGGDLECYPVYTCTVTDALAAGLDFTIGSNQFIYGGALVATDVLEVDADPQAPDVELNGTRDFANTDVDSVFPALDVGWNTVALSDSSKFSLAMAWRGRYF